MAYRKSKGKMSRRSKKTEPAVLTMRFNPVGVTGTSTSFIDLSQCASLLNRRFYRQGINWAVARIKILASSGDPSNRAEGYVQVSKLPTTWVMGNAWEKSMRTWLKQNNEAMEETESVRPRFMDFKVYANEQHHTAGYGANLLPASGSGATATAGEWKPSEMQIPVGTAGVHGQTATREMIAVGGNYPGLGFSGYDAVSLIEGYAASRGLPNVLDPNAPGDASDVDGFNPDNWMAASFNEGTRVIEQVIDELLDSNNIAPYPFENDGVHTDTQYPGGANQLTGLQFHDDSYITSTTIGGHTVLKGGQFPCGLLAINVINTTNTGGGTPVPVDIEYSVQIDLVPGNHRGYLCTPMQDM